MNKINNNISTTDSTISIDNPSSIYNIEDEIGILDPNGINNNPLTNSPYSDTYKHWGKIWSKYPAYENVKDTLQQIKNNQVILVISGTGSGKTVLFPKYMLHIFNYNKKIGITLPKRIVTKKAAEFSAITLDVKLGDIIGYQYKGHTNKSKNTKLLYATDGTIVMKLINDPLLTDFDSIIIDEAHERKIQIDLLLYLLKNVLKNRPEFKLVIMSATVNENTFKSYYDEYKFVTLNIGSKTNYPINTIYLNKPISERETIEYGYNILLDIVNNNKIINNNTTHDILFFVSSVNDTLKICERVRKDKLLHNNYCIEVYSGIDENKEKIVSDASLYRELGDYNRKIILATPVAESSLTINGIKYVIDSGYELHNLYDPKTRAKKLERSRITKAQAIQRRGRSGRTESGICYCLYTENEFNQMEDFPLPEIRVNNLYEEMLKLMSIPQIKTKKNLLNILSQFIEPPKEIYITSALLQLEQLKLIDSSEITYLGNIVMSLRMEPMLGITLLLSKIYNCLNEVSIIIALLELTKYTIGGLFINPKDIAGNNKELYKKINDKFIKNKKKLSHPSGDHLSLLNIYYKYLKYYKKKDKNKLNEWCYENFLKKSILEKTMYKSAEIKKSIYRLAKEIFHENKLSLSLPDKNELLKSGNYNVILFCFVYSYRIQIGLKNKDAFNIPYDDQHIKISQDSFLNINKNLPQKIIYHELFSSNNKKELNIVSNLPNNIYDMFKKI
jgi:HrpA-like RNA helicase